MQWHLLQSHIQTDQKHSELVASLHRQFEEGKEELLRLVVEQGEENVQVPASNMMTKTTTAAPFKGTAAYTAATAKQPFAALTNIVTKKVQAINIHVTTGPHAGMTVTVQPKPNAACFVGRSAGKKFREKGVSLAKDSEVSTTHGKFEIVSGKAFFTDVGSTNGTTYRNQALPTNEALLLEDSVELILGGSTLRITLS